MEGEKIISLGARKHSKRKTKTKTRLVRSIVTYLKSDNYLFAPLFSNSESPKADDVSIVGFEALGIEMVNKKRIMPKKVKEYLKSDSHMYGPIISPPKLNSPRKEYLDSAYEAGKVQITNLVTMEVSQSTTTMREDNNNYRNLRSDITEQTLQNGRINSPKRAVVMLEGQRTGLSHETDLSPAFSSLPEKKMVKADQRRVAIK